MASKNDGYDLASLAFELTVLGFIVALSIGFASNRFDGREVSAVIIFMASAFMFKMFYPFGTMRRFAWMKVVSFLGIFLFSWSLIWMSERTRAVNEQMGVIRERVEEIVEEAPAYVLAANATGRITATSNNIQSLTGYNAESLIDTTIGTLIRDTEGVDYERAYEEAAKRLRSGNGNVEWLIVEDSNATIIRRDGTIVPIVMYAGGVRWTDGDSDGRIDFFAILVPRPLPGIKIIKEGGTVYEPPSPTSVKEK